MVESPIGTNIGHGHAWERPDGVKARCGGVALCPTCRSDQALVDSRTFDHAEAVRELLAAVDYLLEVTLPEQPTTSSERAQALVHLRAVRDRTPFR